MKNLPLTAITAFMLSIVLPVNAGETKPKWEYLTKQYTVLSSAQLTKDLNKLEDWELVNCETHGSKLLCIFKRPKQ
jgi:hypothetical protein